jgi:nucleotide-binding universal stress UspA family protein
VNTILVPLDGSPLAEQVLPYARLLATTLGADLLFVRVVAEEDRYPAFFEHAALREFGLAPGATGAQPGPTDAVLRQRAEAYLETLAEPLRDAGITVNTEVAFGLVPETIVQRATTHEARLIAISTHGYSGLRRWALGSVTDRVAHLAPMPVFVVRKPAPTPLALGSILVPLDGSPESRAALPLALELAQQARAELNLLTVVIPPIGLDTDLALLSLLPEDRSPLEARLLSELDELRGQAEGLTITPLVAEGFAADTICDTALRCGAGLIVMAAHGYSGLRRWALGSTADKVLHASTTPVLLVRATRQAAGAAR